MTVSPSIKLSLKAANCVVVEDSLAGIVSAKGAGIARSRRVQYLLS